MEKGNLGRSNVLNFCSDQALRRLASINPSDLTPEQAHFLAELSAKDLARYNRYFAEFRADQNSLPWDDFHCMFLINPGADAANQDDVFCGEHPVDWGRIDRLPPEGQDMFWRMYIQALKKRISSLNCNTPLN